MFDWISISFCKKDLCCFLNWCILPSLFTVSKKQVLIIYLDALINTSYKYDKIEYLRFLSDWSNINTKEVDKYYIVVDYSSIFVNKINDHG